MYSHAGDRDLQQTTSSPGKRKTGEAERSGHGSQGVGMPAAWQNLRSA